MATGAVSLSAHAAVQCSAAVRLLPLCALECGDAGAYEHTGKQAI